MRSRGTQGCFRRSQVVPWALLRDSRGVPEASRAFQGRLRRSQWRLTGLEELRGVSGTFSRGYLEVSGAF